MDISEAELAARLSKAESRSQSLAATSGLGIVPRSLRRLSEYRFRYCSSVIARRLAPRRAGVAPTFWGRGMSVPIGDYDGSYLWLAGTLPPAEVPLIRYLMSVLTKDDVLFDVGANLGFFSLLAADAGRCAVHAFEPNPAVLSYTRDNLGQVPLATLHEVAISDRTGRAQFASSSGHLGASQLAQEGDLSVEVTTLDRLCADLGPPTIMKIDIEGGELMALRGAEAMLRDYSPRVVLEVHLSDESGYSALGPAVAFARGLGYEVQLLGSDGTATAFAEHQNVLDDRPAGTYLNVLLDRPGRDIEN